MSTALISARIPSHHKSTMDERPGKLTEHINAAVTMYVESLRAPAKVERIPTAKKKATVKPLSAHTKARLAVYNWLTKVDDATSSYLAFLSGQSTNNIAKRLGELHAAGYAEPTGEYRKSLNSNNMLTVWRRTSKELPC